MVTDSKNHCIFIFIYRL
ncbi:MAG: hypothetical protein ACJ0ON_00755 [Candidatus Marisimplicoccus sp.]